MQKISANPYPGFDETGYYCEPQPVARVKPEGEENASRSKGSIDLFVAEKHTHVIAPPPSPRLQTQEAWQNYEISRTGHMGNLLGGKGQPPPKEPLPVARLTPQSMIIAEGHKGQQMNSLFTNYGKREPSPRPVPRVKVEAEDNADNGRGRKMNALLHNPNSIPETPRTAPRIKPEAEEIAEKGLSGNMLKIFGHYGQSQGTSRGVPRVKPEAEVIAKLDRGIQMEGLFHHYGKQKPMPQPQPKVKDGKDMAEMDRGGRMSRLMHEIQKLPSNHKPPLRAVSSAGRRNIKNSRGSISNIFAETSKWQIIPKAGVRN
uniref:Uncharacterized protein n=1 Tax=Arion vulgaris TaxID=1028688 RepID=A0A0B6ZT72_9EUPU